MSGSNSTESPPQGPSSSEVLSTPSTQSPRIRYSDPRNQTARNDSFPSGANPVLEPLRYDPHAVSSALVDNSFIPMLSKVSASRHTFILGPQECEVQSEVVLPYLETWMSIFDQAFFFNSLLKHLKLLVDSEMLDDRFGYFSIQDGTITIHNRVVEDRRNTYLGSFAQECVCTLLHEMVHAWLRIFSRDNDEVNSSTHVLGLTGHGVCWIKSAAAVQFALQSVVPWDVRCGIGRGVEAEMEIESWVPDRALLQSCELVHFRSAIVSFRFMEAYDANSFDNEAAGRIDLLSGDKAVIARRQERIQEAEEANERKYPFRDAETRAKRKEDNVRIMGELMVIMRRNFPRQ